MVTSMTEVQAAMRRVVQDISSLKCTVNRIDRRGRGIEEPEIELPEDSIAHYIPCATVDHVFRLDLKLKEEKFFNDAVSHM